MMDEREREGEERVVSKQLNVTQDVLYGKLSSLQLINWYFNYEFKLNGNE